MMLARIIGLNRVEFFLICTCAASDLDKDKRVIWIPMAVFNLYQPEL